MRLTDKLPVMSGLDYIRDKNYDEITRTYAGSIRLGDSRMPKDLKLNSFHTVSARFNNYWRISYAK